MNGLSLIICTYNGSQRLALTLKYIAEQKVADFILWEVLIISNASTDNTLVVAKEIWQQIGVEVPFRVEIENKPGKENAIVKGFELAQYEFMSIVDDDNWLAPEYVNTAYKVMSAQPSIGILGARAIGEFEVPPPKWFKQFEAVYAVGHQSNGLSGPLKQFEGYIYGAGSVTRKSAWQKLLDHGFEFTTSTKRGKILVSGEDIEVGDAMQLAGYTLWYEKNLTFKHFMYKERLTWPYLLRIGKGTASSGLTSTVYYFIFRHPEIDEKKFRYLYWKRLIWLLLQIIKKPTALFHYIFKLNDEKYTDTFEMLRLINNFKTSFLMRKQALGIFRKIMKLKESFSNNNTF